MDIPVKIQYDDKKEIPTLIKHFDGNMDSYNSLAFIPFFTSLAKGDYNVLGPLVLSRNELISYGNTIHQYLFYADDQSSNLDIKVIYRDSTGNRVGPVKVDYLNSEFDDAYPAIGNAPNVVYHCSNRAGKFDIYQTVIGTEEISNKTNLMQQLLAPNNPVTTKMDLLSVAGFDDKCPYISGINLMVFTSNRPGGFGGFDIYYSIYKNGSWGVPVNAGPRINTEADEYRPIITAFVNFSYPLMIFSSNRKSGKGGFDLYMTGLYDTDNMGNVK